MERRYVLTPTASIGVSSDLQEFDQTMLAPGNQYFMISLDETAESDITVAYSITGSATAGTDYTGLTSGTVTISSGMSTGMGLYVTGVADGVVEGDETIVITIDPGSGYIAGATATMNVIDEPLPTVQISVSAASLEEYDSTMMAPDSEYFMISLDRTTGTELTVSYTVSGTATGSGTDYVGLESGTVTIPAGMTTGMGSYVTAVRDGIVEGNETIIVTIDPSPNYIDGATATMTIIDEPLPTVSIAMATGDALEWDSTTDVPLAAQVQFSADSNLMTGLTINYTVTGTASNGTDYAVPGGLSGTFTLMPGMPGMNLLDILPVIDAVEGNETVTIALNAGTGYQLGTTTSVTFNIIDAPTPSVSISFAADAYEYDDTADAPINGAFLLTRTGPYLSLDLTVNMNLSGSATNGVDYNSSAPTSVTFPANATTVLFDVVPIEDLDFAEGTELVIGSIAPSSNYTIVAASTSLAVFDAAKPEVTITECDSDAAEGFDDADDAYDVQRVNGSFLISRTGSTTFPLTINYTLAASTATLGNDYTLSSVTIPVGQTSQFVIVEPQQDNDFLEGPETVEFQGTTFAGAPYTMAAADTAVVTIQDVNRKPIVPNLEIWIPRNRTGIIGNINATDKDTGQTLTYAIEYSPLWPVPFSIDAAGNIFVSGALAPVWPYDFNVRVTDNGFPNMEDWGEVDVYVYDFDARPVEVDFQNNHTAYRDPTPSGGGDAYPGIEWVNGVVTAPVVYSGTNNPKSKVQFYVNEDWNYGYVKVKGSGPDGYEFAEAGASHSEGGAGYDVIEATVTSSKAFPYMVDYLASFAISWSISIDNGMNWADVGSSSHEVFVTYMNPLTKLYRTLLDIAVIELVGYSGGSSLAAATFVPFSDNIVNRHDGTTMIYNHSPAYTSALDLLKHGNGECTAWTELFMNAIKVNGLSLGTSKKIVGNGHAGFIVNNAAWDGEANWHNNAHSLGYRWKWNDDPANAVVGIVTPDSNNPLDSQGFGDPAQKFGYHQVVVSNGVIYDVAYGRTYSSLAAWEEASVAGFVDKFGSEQIELVRKRVSGETGVRWE